MVTSIIKQVLTNNKYNEMEAVGSLLNQELVED